jgi:hypothetical protein
VPAGGAVLVPRGTPHTDWNPHPTATRHVLIMTPRIKALIDAIHTLPERNQPTLEAAFREHASDYLGWPSSALARGQPLARSANGSAAANSYATAESTAR